MHVDVPEVDSHGAMDQAVYHRVGLHSAAEATVPFGRRVLGAEHGRLRRVAPLDQLEQ